MKNNKQRPHFWTMQFSFWLFFSVISLFTLTLWYAELGWGHIAHTLLQSMLGLLMSLPLFWVFMRIWDKPILIRLTVSISCVLFIALVWTIIRMYLFSWIIGEENLWVELGGWYFSSIFVFLCWAGLCHGIKYYYLLQKEHIFMLDAEAQAKTEQLKRERAQTAARDAKIKMLRYQLNPHFLCNTLNAINSLIEIEEPERAQLMTVQLSKFLRYSLDNNPDTKLALEHELNALNLYLEIEKTRFGDRLSLDFNISDEARSAHVPSLLIQPIIENSMKHVIAQNEEGGTISIFAEIVDEQLVLELSDTGDMASKSKINRSSRGVGLSNIDERLKALYDDNYIFELTIMPSGGIKTTIKIPYEYLETH